MAKARAWLAEVEGETAALVAELKSWDRHDRISAVSCITVSPKRRRLGLDFHLLPDHANAHGEDTVAFLKQLKRHIPGPMTILRDKGNIHDRSKVVRPTWRSTRGRHREVAELRPRDESGRVGVGHTKHGRLSNFTPEETAEFRAVMVEEFERIHRRPDLLAAFIRHAKVPIRLRC
ncbi:MAG: hypothetical protein WKF75_19830 [Singulisphaera sp.]